MKDWRDCETLLATSRKEPIKVNGQVYLMTRYDFNVCYKCLIKKCKGKILISAERKALGVATKFLR